MTPERDISIPHFETIRHAISTGRIFSVTFIKRSDGQIRKMVCRAGVHSLLTGTGAAYNAASHDLLTVWDMQKGEYRSIPVEMILSMRVQGVTCTFTAPVPVVETHVAEGYALVRMGGVEAKARLLKSGELATAKATRWVLPEGEWERVRMALRGEG